MNIVNGSDRVTPTELRSRTQGSDVQLRALALLFMNHLKLMPLFAVVLAMTVSSAFANRGLGKNRSGLGPILSEFDTNKDGTVSAAEFAAAEMALANDAKTALFNKYDTNHDGVITTDEALAIFDTVSGDWLEDLVARFDRNHDGAISRADFGFLSPLFSDLVKQFDTNGDDAVTADELQAAVREKSTDRLETLLDQYDANDDGAISMAEALDAIQDTVDDKFDYLLARYDLNHDGAITSDEVQKVDRPKKRKHR